EPKVALPSGTQAQNSEAKALSAMFGASMSENINIEVTSSSGLTPTAGQNKESVSDRNLPGYEVKSQQVLESAIVKSKSNLASTYSSRQERISSSLLEREIASESGRIDQDIASLFNDLKKDIRQIIIAYQLRKRPIKVTLHLTQGVIDEIRVLDVPETFVREVQSLLLGHRISIEYTGVKNHVLLVN
ncbi:hypothetical protein, partial [Vibrio sp. 10N.261.46.A3]|uniref:hypothetical protein n=1 Tax=Vibrio sp. 10N.261.46.A3 TaxID=3229658 RepID=UPI0035533CBB